MISDNDPKNELRQKHLKMRVALDPLKVHDQSILIEEKVLKNPLWISARRIALYSPVKNEVETHLLFLKGLEQGKEIYYPKVEQGLNFYQVEDYDQFVKGAWGILEPNETCRLLPPSENLDLIILPGIVFDRLGYRIGYGRGFYDRVMAERKLIAMGLGFQCQLVDEIPRDDWDQRLSALVTEKEEVLVRGNEG